MRSLAITLRVLEMELSDREQGNTQWPRTGEGEPKDPGHTYGGYSGCHA